MTPSPGEAVDAVWRAEAPALIGALLRTTRDLDLAEDVAQDALVAALDTWPRTGIPERPGAWLLTVARRRTIDRFRRHQVAEASTRLVALLAEDAVPAHVEPDQVHDDVLRLVFLSCHPALSRASRVALTLRHFGGMSTSEVARALLSQESTMAQRLTRAKRVLAEQDAIAEDLSPDEQAARLPSVLEVLYLIFNEGHVATHGERWARPELCAEAIRLAGVLAGLVPHLADAHALLALMEIQASRLPARADAAGRPVPLLEQDRDRWDRAAIDRGLDALERARALQRQPGRYLLQAEVAACHAVAATAEETDWGRMAELYRLLRHIDDSPVVAVNMAVAVSRAQGPDAAMAVLSPLFADPRLARYHLLHAVHADVLASAGRAGEAAAAFGRAAAMTSNDAERRALLDRMETLRDGAA